MLTLNKTAKQAWSILTNTAVKSKCYKKEMKKQHNIILKIAMACLNVTTEFNFEELFRNPFKQEEFNVITK